LGTDIGVTESLLKTKQTKIVRYSRLHAARSPLEIWDSCSLTEFMTLWSERSRPQLAAQTQSIESDECRGYVKYAFSAVTRER
jgi:hypothetical protein